MYKINQRLFAGLVFFVAFFSVEQAYSANFSCSNVSPPPADQQLCNASKAGMCFYGIYDATAGKYLTTAKPGNSNPVVIQTNRNYDKLRAANGIPTHNLFVCGTQVNDGGNTVNFILTNNTSDPVGIGFSQGDTTTLTISSFQAAKATNYPAIVSTQYQWAGGNQNPLWNIQFPDPQVPANIPKAPQTPPLVGTAKGIPISSSSSMAYVQSNGRQAPGQVDVINPNLVLLNDTQGVQEPTLDAVQNNLVYGRLHSWASGMTYASNHAQYWVVTPIPSKQIQYHARQMPIWVQPMIAVYTSQPLNGAGNYLNYDWLHQAQAASGSPFNDYQGASVIFGPPGFHLSAENVFAIKGGVYSGGTNRNSLHYLARANATNTKTGSLQVGITQAEAFLDTLAIYPAQSDTNYYTSAFQAVPTDAKASSEGDWDIVFKMQDPNQLSNQNLTLALAEGSPFAQFTANNLNNNNHVITVGAVYWPSTQTSSLGKNLPSKLKGISSSGSITPVQSFNDPLSGKQIDYQIIYQPLNKFHNDLISPSGTNGAAWSNWSSFAVMWLDEDYNKSLLPHLNDKDHLTYYTLGLNPNKATQYFVIASLPNQYDSTAEVDFDTVAAQNWAKAIGPYAFNYYQGKSKISFSVGKESNPNNVDVSYTPNLINVISQKATDLQTLFLLQSYQYTNDPKQGKAPLNQNANEGYLFNSSACTTTSKNIPNCYSSVRGKLMPYHASILSLTYIMPPIMPYFPSSELAKSNLSANGQTYPLNDVGFWLANSAFTSMMNSPPANTNLGHGTIDARDINPSNPGQMNAPYGVGTSAYSTARLLGQVEGLTQPGSEPDYYSYQWYERDKMMQNMDAQLKALFQYFFSSQPTGPVANDKQVNSYVYAYYNSIAHHLILYPSGTAAGAYPADNSSNNGVYDAFGTATKLGDNAYTWGYLIAAAAIDKLVHNKNPQIFSQQPDWLTKATLGPAIDLMIQDIAYADTADNQPISWWVDNSRLSFPRLEFMDLWSGIAYTDGFLGNDAPAGKQHNSAQEAQLSWAAIYLWGEATQRKSLADLGAFLYTLGAYANNAYFTGQNNDFTPSSSGSSSSVNGSYIPRVNVSTLNATTDTGNIDACWNGYGQQDFTIASLGNGASAWDVLPGSRNQTPTYYAAGVYQGQQIEQGEDGESPLNALFNIIYPLTPSTLSVFSNPSYMKSLSSGVLNNSGLPPANMQYMSTLNEFFDALGISSHMQESYYDPNSAEIKGQFPSCAAGVSDWAACTSSILAGPPAPGSGYQWLTNKLSSLIANGDINGELTIDGDNNHVCSGTYAQKLASFYNAGTDSGSGLTDAYIYSMYGAPTTNVDTHCDAPGDSTLMQPMCVAFSKGNSLTYMAYNPNSTPLNNVIVHVANQSDSSSVTVQPYSFYVWNNSSLPPNVPTYVTVSNITTTSATLAWTESGYKAGYTFTLQGITGGSLGNVSCNTNGSCTGTLSGLTSNTTYNSGQLQAAYNAQKSSWTAIPSFTTGTPLPNAPSNITVSNVTLTSATLAWTESGYKAGYTFTLQGITGGSLGNVSCNTNGSCTGTLSGLTSNTTYNSGQLQAAYNAQKSSWTVIPSFTTGVPLPNPPSNVTVSNVTLTSATLAWTESGYKAGYTFTLQGITGGSLGNVSCNINGSCTGTLNGLTSNTTYNSGQLQAAYNAQKSSWTAIPSFTTGTPLPNAPSNVTVINTTATTATLFWTEIGYKSDYSFVVSGVNSGNLTNARCNARGSCMGTLIGLASNTTYSTGYLQAISQAQKSNLTRIPAFQTSVITLQAPVILNVTRQPGAKANVIVSFQSATGGDGRYTYTYNYNGNQWNNVVSFGSANTVLLRGVGLQSNATVSITVHDAGVSLTSASKPIPNA